MQGIRRWSKAIDKLDAFEGAANVAKQFASKAFAR
jgi:hypothetical protein